MSRHVHVGRAVNFLGTPELDISAVPGHSHAELSVTVPATVCLQAGDGPVRFLFNMTADGARALADLLVIAAQQIEQQTEGA